MPGVNLFAHRKYNFACRHSYFKKQRKKKTIEGYLSGNLCTLIFSLQGMILSTPTLALWPTSSLLPDRGCSCSPWRLPLLPKTFRSWQLEDDTKMANRETNTDRMRCMSIHDDCVLIWLQIFAFCFCCTVQVDSWHLLCKLAGVLRDRYIDRWVDG